MADVPQLPVGETQESAKMAFVSNALAIVGFIILFIIIVWGLFHIINLSGSSIGSWFSSKPSVTVTAPKSAVSGEPLSISWKYSGSESGSYSFLYQCQNNVALTTGVGGALATIPCGSAINVGSSTSATLVPEVTGNASLNTTISIAFTTSAGVRTEGSATITISKGGAGTATTTPSTTPAKKPTTSTKKQTSYKPTYPTTHKAANLLPHAVSGPADLRVALIEVGVIDPQSGALIPRAPLSPSETVGLEFDIANVGGSATGNWYFTASLPAGYAPYLYTSPLQISLRPGEHIVNVLRFVPNMRPGTITITADPQGRVYDANRSNNTISQQL